MLDENGIKQIQVSSLQDYLYDLSIMSKKVLVEDIGFERAIICVKGGLIVKIETKISNKIIEEIQQQSNKFIDYGDKIIMSGVIDINVSLHANYEEKEWAEIQNLTRIALAGGTTMVVNNPLLENPNNIVELNQTLSDCDEKIAALKENSYVDFAQLALLTKTNYQDLNNQEKMKKLQEQIIGFRTYFSPYVQPEVDYCSNKMQILSFIDSLKDFTNLSIFVHPIYLQCEKELGVTSPLRDQKINSRIEIEKSIDIINERAVPCADAVQGETHEEERWSSFELEPLQNNQDQKKLLKIFPMAQLKTMQSALKLLSIQEKRQYLGSQQNTECEENYKSGDEESKNTKAQDRYIEFKNFNEAKHSCLSIESEDEVVNNFQNKQNDYLKDGTSIQVIDLKPVMSINLDSSRFLAQLGGYDQSNEYLTEIERRTSYRNSLSPQKKDKHRQTESPRNNQILQPKATMIPKSEQKIHTLSNKKPLLIPQKVFQNEQNDKDQDEESSPLSSKKLIIRPKANSNLLIRRKIQMQKSDNNESSNTSPTHPSNSSSPSVSQLFQQGSVKNANFLMHSNSNLHLTGSELSQADGTNQMINLSSCGGQNQNQPIQEEEENQGENNPQKQADFNRMRSQTSTLMLNTKLKSKNVEMQVQLRNNYLYFQTFRPPFWENIAINFFKQKFTEYQSNKIQFNPTLVFTNVSNSYSVAKIFRQKLRNPDFKLFLEVSSPFLYFDSSNIKDGETKFKSEPAIYDKLNKKLLLAELQIDSVIDCVGSNHFYVPPQYKPPDFTRAFNGLTSIGANLYSIWTLSWINLKRKLNQDNYFFRNNIQSEYKNQSLISMQNFQECFQQDTSENSGIFNDLKQEGISLNKENSQFGFSCFDEGNNLKLQHEMCEQKIEKKLLELSKLLSMNPAKILGITNQKGQIKIGLDADFVVWDPFAQTKFRVSDYQSNPDIPPLHIFDRKNFYGKIYSTIIRGNILYNLEQSGANQSDIDQQFSSKIIEDELSEKFSPFLKRNQQDLFSHKFIDKQQFNAKLIIKK